MNRKQKRDIMEKAFGTHVRNELIRLAFAQGATGVRIARAAKLSRQEVWRICQNDKEVTDGNKSFRY